MESPDRQMYLLYQLNSDDIVDKIHAARRRVLYAAPGLDQEISVALLDAANAVLAAVENQQLMLEEKRLCDDRAGAARSSEPHDRREQMDGKERGVAHPRIVAINASLPRLGISADLCGDSEFATHRFDPENESLPGVPISSPVRA